MNNITDYVKNLSRLLGGKSQKTNKCKIEMQLWTEELLVLV